MMAEPTPRHCQGWLQDCVNSGFVICARGDCICILTLPVMALTGGGAFLCVQLFQHVVVWVLRGTGD